jgi:homoserine dehydrogenase
VVLAYEASVGGAINILDPLKTISKINKIHKIEGIINGSTNFILSKIFLDDYTLNQALLEANELGYIETNSTDDLDGLDLMRKINILSMISYQQYINEDDISVVPLSSLTTEFIEYIKNHNLIIKYLATSKRINNRIIIHLEPVVFDSNSIYSKINYEDNIISIFGEYHQKQSFIGQGAGRYPTASAVVYDLLKINDNCNNTYNYKNNLIIDNNYCKYYFLVQAGDRIFKSDLLSIKEVLSDKSIKCLARISEALYEKI